MSLTNPPKIPLLYYSKPLSDLSGLAEKIDLVFAKFPKNKNKKSCTVRMTRSEVLERKLGSVLLKYS